MGDADPGLSERERYQPTMVGEGYSGEGTEFRVSTQRRAASFIGSVDVPIGGPHADDWALSISQLDPRVPRLGLTTPTRRATASLADLGSATTSPVVAAGGTGIGSVTLSPHGDGEQSERGGTEESGGPGLWLSDVPPKR